MNYTDLLSLNIQKPARYIGCEWNSSRKDFDTAAVRVVLCFPDLYEVGMSNLGIRILYGILNAMEGISAERAFSPAKDFEQALRARQSLLSSLESKRPLKDFDIVGFSLGHELQFTNVLTMLETGGIPWYARERDARHPLVIGGGPCVMNPEPMHAFFDIFVIGEAEEAIGEIVEEYRRAQAAWRAGDIARPDLLARFARIDGVYIPSAYEAAYGQDGRLASWAPLRQDLPRVIKKRIVTDLDAAYFPAEWLVPYIQIVHDRITLEVMRGCPNRCRFCQGRAQYFPFRVRSKETVCALARKAYACTGYEELALGGLSVSDYPHIEGVLQELIAGFKDKGVSVSLPSLKPTAELGALSSLIARIKKTGLTFAPEAGSARLRDLLAKDFSETDFFATVEAAYRSGYQHVKLYFLIGIPGEDESDWDAIVDFAVRVSELRRAVSGRPAEVHVSVNALIPKPHTPLQWAAMIGEERLREAERRLLHKAARNRRLKFSFHHRELSFLEGVFSRGDRRLAQVIAAAYARGARFDAWDEHRNLARWLEAFKECGIDPVYYLRARTPDELLPWDFIDIGIPRAEMVKEFEIVAMACPPATPSA